ncbi:MAG TPA: hypothetical protein VF659_08265 [Pyrinomonadaceae bacterium]|jgi:hypothetical protein
MSERVELDAVRGEALRRIERGERNFKLAFSAAVVFEGLFLAAFLLAADLTNRTHLLLLIATVGGYTIVVLGLVALGAHVSRGVARVLKAVELLDR